VEAFADNRGSAVHLREAFVKVEVFKNRDLLVAQCQQRMKIVAPPSKPQDPDRLDDKLQKIMTEMMQEFEMKIRPFKVHDEAAQIEDFRMQLGSVIGARRKENLAEIEGAQIKLVAAPVVGTGAFFMTGHPYVDAGILAGAVAFQVNRRKNDMKKEHMDHEVALVVFNDGKRFVETRIRDAHAISIAAQRFNPAAVSDQVMGGIGRVAQVARAGGAIAAAGASSSSGSNVPMATLSGPPMATTVHMQGLSGPSVATIRAQPA